MRYLVTAMLIAALIIPAACVGQVQPSEITPPEPPPPPDMETPEPPAISQAEADLQGRIDMGLISSAGKFMSHAGLMVQGRELTPQQRRRMHRARAVGELFGMGGRNFFGTLSAAAVKRGSIQDAIRDLQAGNTGEAIEGLKAAIAELPDAKMLHRLLASAYSSAGQDAPALDHRMAAIGLIPSEDLIFVELVRSLSPEGEPDDAEVISMPSEPQPASVATVTRMSLGSLLLDRTAEAGNLLQKARELDTSDATPNELAAGAMAELAYTALPLLEETEDFTGRQEMPESIVLAGIAATDGRWAQGSLPRLSEAGSLAPEGETGNVVRAMDALVQSVLGVAGEPISEIAQVADRHDLPLTRKYLETVKTQ